MKKVFYQLTILVVILLVGSTQSLLAQKNKNTAEPQVTIEQVAEKCKGLPANKRVTVRVARFDVTKANAEGKFGDELATMLTAALQQTNCFRVLEMLRNDDSGVEIANSQGGFTGNSGPEAGQMLAAQLLITGEVTEYLENERATWSPISSGTSKKVRVGFTLKIVNPQTNEILASKSIRAEGKESGSNGSVLGIPISKSTENSAVADACGIAVIRSAEYLADQKDKMEIPEPMKPEAAKKIDPSKCTMLKSGAPKVMILIPEAQNISTTTDNRMVDRRSQAEIEAAERQADRELIRDIFGGKRRQQQLQQQQAQAQQQQQATTTTARYKPVVIEQATTENVLIQKFIEAGFKVIDPNAYNKLRKQQDTLQEDNVAKLAAIGLRLGANIIITGNAVSERVNNNNSLVAFRGRIELRAITTDDATILASNTIQAGGVDVSESVASKIALRNAGNKMADYMLEQLCSRNVTFASTGPAKPARVTSATAEPTTNVTDISVANATFAKLSALAGVLTKNPKVKTVQKSLKGTDGKLHIEHLGSTDDLLDVLGKSPATKFDVTDMEEGKVSLTIN